MDVFLSVLMTVIFATLIAWRECARRAALRLCRTAIARAGKSCSYCSFDLRGLAEIGQCPECGRWYSAADLQEVWLSTERWLQKKYWFE